MLACTAETSGRGDLLVKHDGLVIGVLVETAVIGAFMQKEYINKCVLLCQSSPGTGYKLMECLSVKGKGIASRDGGGGKCVVGWGDAPSLPVGLEKFWKSLS